jgi:VIT1/CCC1 family predicted Fe2+/Mn2+ transporter
MAPATVGPSGRVLDPIDRISEILFGLIMVLTFTGSLSIAEAGRDDTRTMLIGALGCNLAWGIIDAVLYLMGGLAGKGRIALGLRAARRSSSPDQARQAIARILPEPIAGVLEPREIAALEERLRRLPEPSAPRLDRDDWLGGLAVFLLVFLSTFPVAIPFLLMDSAVRALRVSNLIAIVMLFALGYRFAQLTGRRPWAWGLSMVVLGAVLASLTMALGG